MAVAIALLAGYLVGKSTGRADSETLPAGSVPRPRLANPSASGGAARSTALATETVSPDSSPLAEALEMEHHLATCELDQFPGLMEAAISGRDPSLQSWKIMKFWAIRDRDACTAWIASQSAHVPIGARGNTSINLRSNLIQQIANHDSAAAWETADRLRANENAKFDILREVLDEDPEKALALASAHPDVMITGGSMAVYARPGFSPLRSIPVIDALHPGGARNSLANDGINHYLAHPEHLAEAGEWFKALPPETKRFVIHRLERNHYEPRFEKNLAELRQIWTLP